MSQVNLYLLGPPRIERDDLPVKVDTQKATALLAYIAITGGICRRDSLVTLLWPEYDSSRGRTNLRRTLYALRKALVDDYLAVDRETVEVKPRADIWLDVAQFHKHLNECLVHGHSAAQACPACIEPLTAVVKLYRGDFMSGFSLKDSLNFDEWQFNQTESLRSEFASALERLTRAYLAQGNFDSAIHYAKRWLALDKLNEAAHCLLMQLYEWDGQYSAVHRQYQDCLKILQEELGVPPQASTTALFHEIIQGQHQEPPVSFTRQSTELSQLDQFVEGPLNVTLVQMVPENKKQTKSVFVARERELDQLGHILDEAMRGQGRPVFITGSAGQGKTYLIQEFAQRAQARIPSLLFAYGNCNAHIGLGDPYLPFREILGLLTGDVDALWTAGAITQEHARRLWDAFPHVVEALLEVGPDLIETFISGTALARRSAAYSAGGMSDRAAWLSRLEELVSQKVGALHDPNLQQAALFEQYTRLMLSLARGGPILLALDDLQWADAGSISLLFHLGRRLSGRRILILGAYRPEEVVMGRQGERHPLEVVINEFQSAFGEIEIDLSRAESRSFVDAYLDNESNRLADDFRETLCRQTRGHPLFTVELLRGMQERGDLVRDDEGYWVEGTTLDWEILPTRVEAVIAERIGRLDFFSQQVLRLASVEGEVFTAEVLARILSVEVREIIDCLSHQLERMHRLVRAQEIQRLGTHRLSRYRFRHILFQNYLYQSLDAIERSYLHEAVGTALEVLYSQETQEVALSLARHFQEAGLWEKAVAYLFQAGERAIRSSANEAAIAHLTKGMEWLEELPHTPDRDRLELEFTIALGVQMVLTRGHSAPEVEATYSRAKDLCERVGEASQHFQVLLGLRRCYLHREELEKANELGKQLISLAENNLDSTYLSRAYGMHIEILYRLGEFAQIPNYGSQGLSLYDPEQSLTHVYLYGNDTRISVHMFMTLALWYLGYPEQALEIAREMLAWARKLAHPFTLVCGLYFAATLYQLRREVEAVQECVNEVLQISADRGFALYSGWGTMLQGWALTEQGKAREGIQCMQQSLVAWDEMGAKLMMPTLLYFLAEAYAKTGRVDEGLRLLDQALVGVEETKERTIEAELHRLRGELLLLRDAGVSEAERCFEQAFRVARLQSARSLELRAAVSLSRLWLKQGKVSQAIELLKGVYDWFTEGFDTRDLLDAKALLEELSFANSEGA